MPRAAKSLHLQILVALISFGCTVDISQSGVSSLVPALQPSGDSRTSAAPLTNPAAPVGKGTARIPLGSKIPVTWGPLNLKGRLFFLAGVVQAAYLLINVESLDLLTGDLTTIFQTPVDAWIDAEAVSPDGRTLIIAYEPPVGTNFGGQDALYTLPPQGGGAPKLLFTPASNKDRYYQPAWSADGHYLYFTHVNYGTATHYEIMRMAYPDGTPEKVADGGYWPSISTDGQDLVYVSIDPETGKNGLFTERADGTQARGIVFSGPPSTTIIDAPIFLPGNQSVLFSAPPLERVGEPNWAERLLGITVASAHAAIPSDWWVVPVTGGTATRLTHLFAFALFASLSPDRRYIASFSSDSIFVMKPDGTNLTQLVDALGGIPGTVSWIP
jgi:Tol biopolymer transport system component